MKLPGWKETTSTQIRNKGYTLQPGPKMVTAAQHNLSIRAHDPAQSMRLASAEANKWGAIANTVNKGVQLGAYIIEVEEEARAIEAASQYIDEMSQWSADNTVGGEFETVDASGKTVYPWKDARERYEDESKSRQEEILEGGFTTRKAKLRLQQAFERADRANTHSIDNYVRTAGIDLGRKTSHLRMQEIIDDKRLSADDKKTAVLEVLDFAQSTGQWAPDDVAKMQIAAFSDIDKNVKLENYEKMFEAYMSSDSPGDLSILAESVKEGSGMAETLTIAQRITTIGNIQDRIASIHIGNLQRTYHEKGLSVALHELNEISEGGIAFSGAIDDMEHAKMVSKFNSAINVLVSIDNDRNAGMAVQNVSDIASKANASQANIRKLSQDLEDKGARDALDDQVRQLLDPNRPSEDVYSDPLIDTILANTADANYPSKPIINRMETDIKSGRSLNDMLLATQKYHQVERQRPHAIAGMDKSAKDKASSIASYEEKGLIDYTADPVQEAQKIHDWYNKIASMEQDEKSKYMAQSVKSLGANNKEAETLFEDSAKAQGYTNFDVIFPNGIDASSDSVIHWTDAYKNEMLYTEGNEQMSVAAATRATMRRYGGTLIHNDISFMGQGDVLTGKDYPETVYNNGMPSMEMKTQFEGMVNDVINPALDAKGKQTYGIGDLVLERAKQDINGRPTWYVKEAATNNHVYSDPVAGDVYWMHFYPEGLKETKQANIETNNEVGLEHVSKQEQIAATAGFELPPFEDVVFDDHTGWIAPTVTAAADLNAKRYKTLSVQERLDHNRLYHETFNQLMQANTTQAPDAPGANPWGADIKMSSHGVEPNKVPPPPAELELQIHLFLATRGYLRGSVKTPEYWRPPGGY